jgi:hypothetical protein
MYATLQLPQVSLVIVFPNGEDDEGSERMTVVDGTTARPEIISVPYNQ